jgi:tRNA(fMet)-specific endonuclease VapC
LRYLLDTNACSHIQRGHPVIVARLASLPRAAVFYTSVITQGEMLYGAHHVAKARRAKLLTEIRSLLRDMAEVLPVTCAAAERYGRLKAELAKQGTPIPANDIWVAAIAMEAGLIVVSDDAHFEHVPGLRVENWLGADSA